MEKWLVYIDGEVSRCVPHGSPDAVLWRNEGYDLVWDAAPSQFEGWTHAAVVHGCIPDDYDDRMTPGIISEPTALYRSVSIPELEDIVETGEIRGGGNRFNGFDPRPFVFFSGEPNAQCIGQGEDVERLANYLAIKSCLDDNIILTGSTESRDILMSRFKGILADEREARTVMSYTSAVLKTVPIALGFHYSTENGRTGMSGNDEFGLFPGQVKAADITAVYWVKEHQVVATTSFDEVAGILENLARERSGSLAFNFPHQVSTPN